MKDAPERKDGPAEDPAPRPETNSETLQLFSHDIRSAMSDVIGGLRLIDLDRLDPETRLQVDRIRAAGDTLAGLVDAALLAAAGETRIRQDNSAVDLADWLAAQRDRWSGRAQEHQSRFELIEEGDLPAGLRLAQVTLDRIVGNLIGNALIHARGGFVRLKVTGARGDGLRIEVCDDGPGYPDSIIANVRDRGAAAPMGAQAGSGLGLRIVAELVRQVGGGFVLENREGGGCAEVHLPEDLLDWDRSGPTACDPPDLSGLRILVAEDNLTNQTILRQMLDKMRADPVFVADGVAALEMLTRHRFDIALIDIEMPRLSGLEVMQAVRARDDAVARMPLVALTAYVLRDNREAIYAAGADGIIGKPISSSADFGEAVLRLAGRAADLPAPEEVLAGHESTETKMDHARFEALMKVAGPAGQAELLARLAEDLNAACAALDTAVAAGDLAEVRAQTHILIAISGAVGADRLQQLCEVLNIAAKRARAADLAGLHAPCRQDLIDLIRFVAERTAAQR